MKWINLSKFKFIIGLVLLLSILGISQTYAENRVVNLVVSYKTVNFAGKYRKAIAVNNQIPAPTLHFKEGDHVTINVYNHLNEGTAIHWHGILVPWQMDGVEGITQRAIPPGGVFHYQFTLYQSGTYWYHAHAGLQEQEGLYGAFIIDPLHPPAYHYTKDYVVVLSDWSNTPASKILANLKKDGDYYSPKFPLQPSLMKFIHDYRKASPAERKALIEDYKMMQQMRMSIYDLSDVAYDAFLLNGQPNSHPWTAPVKVGDVVRLRFIGAAGSTIYHVKIPGTTMEMVQIDGNNVRPYSVKDFSIAPGETYDVLVKIKKNTPYIIYAESIDTLGKALGALVTLPNQFVDYQQVRPFPEPEPVTREMMRNMMAGMDNEPMNMGTHSTMNENGTSQSTQSMSSQSSTETMNMSGMDHTSMNASHNMEMDHGMTMNSSMKMNTSTYGRNAMPPKSSTKTMNISGMDRGSVNPPRNMENMSKGSMGNMLGTNSAPSTKLNNISNTKKMNHNSMNMETDSAMNGNEASQTMQPMMMPSHSKKTSTSEHSTMPSMSSKPSAATMNMSGMDHDGMSSAHNMKNMSNDISGNMETNHNMAMDHSMNMSMPTEATIVGDTISPVSKSLLAIKTVGTQYQNVIAAVKTNDPTKPIAGVIRMELFGYMGRYIWFINGVPEYKAKPIVINPGKRYRIIFTNQTMMHHPMHIHGHWFILRNGHGAYDPLLHTIDVAPGATAVADFDADASGQWFFHCHHLYHMMSGMARVFQYSTIIDVVKGTMKPQKEISKGNFVNQPIIREDAIRPIDTSLINHPMAHPPGLYLANFLDIGEDPFHNAQEATFKGLYGSDYNKLELFINDAEIYKGTVENADIDIFYWHLISQFWAIKGGVNYINQPSRTPYWQPGIGIEGLMPYFIDTDLRAYYHDGSAKVDVELSRDTQITNNFFIRTGIRSILATKTITQNEIGSGLNQMRYTIRPYYRLRPGLNIFSEFEYDQDYGAFKNLQRQIGESTNEQTVTIGLSMLF